ncbi:MAG: TIGR03085 family metal-binding protein [Candidatus Nanopelagicales bacterium]
MTSYVRSEREALADLLLAVGPDQPTLCEGWDTRDLAAHLVVRERRLDASPGIVLPPLAGWTRHVQDGVAEQDLAALAEQIRTGPPWWSPFGLPGVDERVNLAEFFVHHEDVRRGQLGWEPRDLDPRLRSALWAVARRSSRLLLRQVPVGVVLRRTDAPDGTPDDRVEARVRGGDPTVTLVGPAPELVLRVFGRTAARVDVEGDEAAVRAFEDARLGV